MPFKHGIHRPAFLKRLPGHFDRDKRENSRHRDTDENPTSTKASSTQDCQPTTDALICDTRSSISVNFTPASQSSQSLRSTEEPESTAGPPQRTTNSDDDLWQRSFDALSSEEKMQLQGLLKLDQQVLDGQTHFMSFKRTDVEDFIAITKERQSELSDKMWNFEFCGRKVVPRQYTERIIDCLTIIGDASVPLLPQPAGAVWPFVKGLMQVTVNEGEETAAVLMTTETLIRNIGCGETYEAIFRRKIKAQDPKLWSSFQSSLLKLYVASLRLLAYTIHQCTKHTVGRLVQAFLNPTQTQNQVSDIENCLSDLHEYVKACQAQLGSELDDNVKKLLDYFSIFNSFVDQRFSELFERLDADERTKVLDWISQSKPFDRHDAKASIRTPDTCQWILDSPRFKDWEQSLSPKVLWLQGSPGTGKSFLTSKVIDHLNDRVQNGEGLAFHYCERVGQIFEDPNSVIRSIFRQLAAPAHESRSNQIRKDVRDLFARSHDRMSHPDIPTCKQQILQALSQYSRTTIVLDALDECAEPRNELLDLIDSLLAQSEYPVRIFVSARPECDIEDRLCNELKIATGVPDVIKDISVFISEKLNKLSKWKFITAPVKQKAKETLIDKSEGMFQWASLQVQQLGGCVMDSAVLSRIDQMPAGLTETYREIYEQISENNDQRTVVDRVFIWVMCSYGPMNTDQLLAAIRHDDDNNRVGEKLETTKLLSLCGNLVVLDEPMNCFRFCHASVTEYIEQTLWSSQRAHCYAAKACLRFMILAYGQPAVSSEFPRSCDDEIPAKKYSNGNEDLVIFEAEYPFSFYSRHYWMRHVRCQESKKSSVDVDISGMMELLITFLGSPIQSAKVYQSWAAAVLCDVTMERDAAIFTDYLTLQDILPWSLPILAICRFGLNIMPDDWWNEVSLSKLNEKSENILILAARSGCLPICLRLIHLGVPVDPRSGQTSALAAAVSRENISMAQLLIKEGADVNLEIEGEDFQRHLGSSLAVAASTGNVEMAKVLIQNGAFIDMPLQGDYGSALSTAVCLGELDMATLFIEKRASVNMPIQGRLDSLRDGDGPLGSVLAAAARNCDIKMAVLLIESGADVNMSLQGRFGNALTAAVVGGSLPMVKLLIDKGTNVNMPLKEMYASALTASVCRLELEIFHLLLASGACVNIHTKAIFGSALPTAASYGRFDMVQALIAKGANVNLVDQGADKSALSGASSVGDCSMIRFLVKKGAIIDMPIPRYGSALGRAAFTGHLSAATTLIEMGADVNFRVEGHSGSPLFHAASRGDFRMTEFLIQSGAVVDLPLQGHYGSALVGIVSKILIAPTDCERRLRTLETLIKNGASVNMALQGYYGSVLAAITCFGNLSMTELLIKNGAIVDLLLPGGRFGSALAAAAAGGRVDTVRYLVEKGAANVNLPLKTGSYGTALNAASHWGQTECAKFLLGAGAVVNLSQDHTGFSTALEACRAELCENDREFSIMTNTRTPPWPHFVPGSPYWKTWMRRDRTQIAADRDAVANLLLQHDNLSIKSS